MASAPSVVAWPVESYRRALVALKSVLALVGGERRFAVLVGEAGSGKSFVLRDFCKATENVHLCSLPPADIVTPTVLLQVLAQAIGVEGTFRFKFDAFNVLLSHFRAFSGVLVVDEADRLSQKRLDLLRGLAEATHGAVVLAGCPALEETVRRVPAVATRVASRHVMRAVSGDDLCAVLGHDALFAAEHGLRTWDEAILRAVAQETRGNLRQVQVVLRYLEQSEAGGAALAGRGAMFQENLVSRIVDTYTVRAA